VVESGGDRESHRPSSSRPTPEWLGPRTAKAFAAAGLLDQDADLGGRRPASRFGTTRSSIDDSRSRFAPSRMAFSEAGSSSSWGQRSGSVSRAGSISRTVTDVGGPMSESVSTPRTTFSSASTAPTSISASSHLQSELQLLQERHSVETGALLSALADSQRTARVLRDENTQLRDQLQDVEDRLADALEQIRRLQFTSPPQQTLSISRATNRGLGLGLPDRYNGIGHSRLQTFLSPDHGSSSEVASSPEPPNPSPGTPYGHDTFRDTRSKRISTSSSLFPGPPSNMSMLMHEEGVSTEHSVAFSDRAGSPSPTLVLAKLNASRHSHKRSTSSAGNISPTTADFSMVTGSPGSLNLRPEHELHLGDMPSLDLGAEYNDDDL